MDGIVQELLRLERAKQKALIDGNAPAYDESVRAQLYCLDSHTSDLTTAARLFPNEFATLSGILRQNVALFWNLMRVSPVYEHTRGGYTVEGNIETQVGRRLEVQA